MWGGDRIVGRGCFSCRAQFGSGFIARKLGRKGGSCNFLRGAASRWIGTGFCSEVAMKDFENCTVLRCL